MVKIKQSNRLKMIMYVWLSCHYYGTDNSYSLTDVSGLTTISWNSNLCYSQLKKHTCLTNIDMIISTCKKQNFIHDASV